MSDQQRLEIKERTEQILNAAVCVASTKGYLNLTRALVAKQAGCSVGLVTLRFKSMPGLRRAVMRRAVQSGVLPVVAQGIVAGDAIAKAAPTELKNKAVASLV